jgi:cell division protein ZapB
MTGCNSPCQPFQNMSTLQDLSDRVERLLRQHDELRRTNLLLEQQMATLIRERDLLRTRLETARVRIDGLLQKTAAVAPATTDAREQVNP